MNSILVSARHGSYNAGDLTLNDTGRSQMNSLAESISELAKDGGLPVRILSSSALRAEQGAKIIAEKLGLPKDSVELHECLWDDNQNIGDLVAARELVMEELQKGDCLLLVLSHLDMASHIIYSLQEYFEAYTADNIRSFRYGDAVVMKYGHMKMLT